MNSAMPIRVLLVDDDPDMGRLLNVIVRRVLPDGFQMHTACDPHEALLIMESEIIDLLITDLFMPGISGLELLRHAKRRNAWTQVLLITGHSSLDALTEAMDAGVSDYLLKPLDRAELEEVTAGILKRLRRWRMALAGTLA